MTLAMTYLGIINLASFGCLGIVCFILFYLNCKVRLERDQYKEEAEDYKSEVETYEAMIDKKNKNIAVRNKEISDLLNSDSRKAYVWQADWEPGVVKVEAFTSEGRGRTIRIYRYSTEDERILALNLAEELADKINEQI